jgi:GrpB-like predicted nucleotidyltransferase (UPF0157 family)
LRYTTVMAVIEVVDYDPAWSERFATERDALLPTLRIWLAGEIEHVGSTAVAGLCAKPVIDILVPVHDLAGSRPAIDVLERWHGYLYAPYRSDEMHWLCKPAPDVRTHHVHLIPVTSRTYRQRLAFRDALRTDPALSQRYGELKRQLARQHPDDREAYTEAKAPFIAAVLRSIV